jgi:hypothetical protein
LLKSPQKKAAKNEAKNAGEQVQGLTSQVRLVT